MLRALLVWREVTEDPACEAAIRDLIGGLSRIAIRKDDYYYFPEKGGWGEPCSYPRSGWLNTDESKSETEGGEGSVTAYHGHEIYGASHWYALTGDVQALDLAARLSRYCMQPKFWGESPTPEIARAFPDKSPRALPIRVAPQAPNMVIDSAISTRGRSHCAASWSMAVPRRMTAPSSSSAVHTSSP